MSISAPIIAILAIIGIVIYFFQVLLLVFAGILLAVFLRFFANLIERTVPIGQKLSLVAVLSIIAGAACTFSYFMLPSIVNQINSFLERLPQALEELKRWMADIGIAGQVSQLLGSITDIPATQDILSAATGLFSTTFGLLTTFIVILFIGIFLAAAPDLYVQNFVRMFPPPSRPRIEDVVMKMEKTLRWWLLGRLIEMIFIGVLVTLGLWLIGIPLAVFLGLTAGLLNFIPYIGPVISVIPAILFAMPQGFQTLGLVAALYVVIQSLESYLLTPIIQQKAVNVAPALGLVFQVALGVSAGVFGVAVAGGGPAPSPPYRLLQ